MHRCTHRRHLCTNFAPYASCTIPYSVDMTQHDTSTQPVNVYTRQHTIAQRECKSMRTLAVRVCVCLSQWPVRLGSLDYANESTLIDAVSAHRRLLLWNEVTSVAYELRMNWRVNLSTARVTRLNRQSIICDALNRQPLIDEYWFFRDLRCRCQISVMIYFVDCASVICIYVTYW